MQAGLLKKVDKSTKMLETEIQKIIDDFESKTKTLVLLSTVNNKNKIALAFDLDKLTL
jgi:hypothetical protein